MVIIAIPKVTPDLIALDLFLLFPFEKNATVIGIIGKTHGVSIAINPAMKAKKNLLAIPAIGLRYDSY